MVAPLALTIVSWVFLMNLMDLIPVDWLPLAAGTAGVPYLKIVPTTDVNITFGMSITVFLLMIFYSIKIKGGIGFRKEFTFHPIAPPTKGIAIIAAPIDHRVQSASSSSCRSSRSRCRCRCGSSATCTRASSSSFSSD